MTWINKQSYNVLNILSKINDYSLLAHFERFGGDPMKRSMSNQITSHISSIYLINSLSGATLFSISVIFGHYPYWLGVAIAMSTVGTLSFILLGLSLILIFKNLRLYKFSFASGLNDDFFSHFFLFTNLILSYGTQIYR